MNAVPDARRVGEIVAGKYRIVRLLARGGMGVVYEAQHTVVRRRFAIKFLRRDLAERREILTRFQREAEAAGALEHENVAAAVDFGIAEDRTPYILMEYLVGESLAALLEREGRLPVSRATDLLAQACTGVAAAHAAGIIHRDLKPHNLFVCRRHDGTDLLKVLDFGVAKLQVAEDESAATRTGMVLGTAAYMSPEQARGEKIVDGRTDVYALGAILYETLSLKRPHPGDSQNAILHHISTQPAVPLESVQADLPPALVELVGRALVSDPAGRPATVEALAEGLAPFARRDVFAAREESGPARGEVTSTVLAPGAGAKLPWEAPSRAPSTANDRGPAPSPRARRGAWLAGGAGGVLAAGVIVAVAVHRPSRSMPVDSASAAAAAAPVPAAPPPVAPPPVAVPPTERTVADSPRGPEPGVPGPDPVPPPKPVGRPGGHAAKIGGRPTDRPARPPPAAPVSNPATPPAPVQVDSAPRGPSGPTFDPANPYR
ncbi:MAG TPA: serine/threonine-protein kinase [Polyangia bacterium]|nr:serine/threonine-protein kinase [Polyangia bacterium]